MSHASMWGRRLAVLLLLLLLLLPGGEVGGEAPLAGRGAPLPLALLLPLALPACATRAERSVSPELPSAAGAPLSPWPSSCAQPLGAPRSASRSSTGGIPPPPSRSSEFHARAREPKSSYGERGLDLITPPGAEPSSARLTRRPHARLETGVTGGGGGSSSSQPPWMMSLRVITPTTLGRVGVRVRVRVRARVGVGVRVRFRGVKGRVRVRVRARVRVRVREHLGAVLDDEEVAQPHRAEEAADAAERGVLQRDGGAVVDVRP